MSSHSLCPTAWASSKRSSHSSFGGKSSESVFYVPNLRPPRPKQDANDVEAHLVEVVGEAGPLPGEVPLGGKPDPGPFAGCYGLQRVPEPRPPPELDLDEDQGLDSKIQSTKALELRFRVLLSEGAPAIELTLT